MKEVKSLKDLRKYRKALYNAANSKTARYGRGLSAVNKILLHPLTLVGIVLGIALCVLRIKTGSDPITAVGFGAAVILFAVLMRITNFLTALMAGFLLYDLSIAVSVGVTSVKSGFGTVDLSTLISVCTLNLLLIGIFCFSLYLREKTKERPHYISVSDGNDRIFTEHAAMNLLPLPFLTALSEITLPPFSDEREALQVASKLLKKAYTEETLLISFKLTGGIKETLTLFLLSDGKGKVEKEIKALYPETEIEEFKGDFWEILKERGLPEESKIFEIFNEKMYYDLQKKGVDDSVEHTLLYSFLFKTEEKISDFLKEVEKEEYTPFTEENSRLYSKSDDKPEGFVVILKKRTKIGLQRLHSNTEYLSPVAETFGGKFNGWVVLDI